MNNLQSEWNDNVLNELENRLVVNKDNKQRWLDDVANAHPEFYEDAKQALEDGRSPQAALRIAKRKCVDKATDSHNMSLMTNYMFQSMTSLGNIEAMLEEIHNQFPSADWLEDLIDSAKDVYNELEELNCKTTEPLNQIVEWLDGIHNSANRIDGMLEDETKKSLTYRNRTEQLWEQLDCRLSDLQVTLDEKLGNIMKEKLDEQNGYGDSDGIIENDHDWLVNQISQVITAMDELMNGEIDENTTPLISVNKKIHKLYGHLSHVRELIEKYKSIQ